MEKYALSHEMQKFLARADELKSSFATAWLRHLSRHFFDELKNAGASRFFSLRATLLIFGPISEITENSVIDEGPVRRRI